MSNVFYYIKYDGSNIKELKKFLDERDDFGYSTLLTEYNITDTDCNRVYLMPYGDVEDIEEIEEGEYIIIDPLTSDIHIMSEEDFMEWRMSRMLPIHVFENIDPDKTVYDLIDEARRWADENNYIIVRVNIATEYDNFDGPVRMEVTFKSLLHTSEEE